MMVIGPIAWLWIAWVMPAGPAGPGVPGPERIRAELARLDGHRVAVAPDGAGYTIEDVAGEGKPVVGVVERRGDHLWLVSEGGAAYRLTGRLARPRIAGPGYKVWALGTITGPPSAPVLHARRLGVLASPW